ncbi:unnamed protein product [Bubo scandiacus]
MSHKIWCKDSELLMYSIPQMEFVAGVLETQGNDCFGSYMRFPISIWILSTSIYTTNIKEKNPTSFISKMNMIN